MRSLSRIIVTALAALLVFPAAASAQDVIVEPPIRCMDCWWPVGSVAQLDGIEADIGVTDGVTVARYRFDLSNPVAEGQSQGGPGAEGRIVFPVPAGSSVTDLVLSGGPCGSRAAPQFTHLYHRCVCRPVEGRLPLWPGHGLVPEKGIPKQSRRRPVDGFGSCQRCGFRVAGSRCRA